MQVVCTSDWHVLPFPVATPSSQPFPHCPGIDCGACFDRWNQKQAWCCAHVSLLSWVPALALRAHPARCVSRAVLEHQPTADHGSIAEPFACYSGVWVAVPLPEYAKSEGAVSYPPSPFTGPERPSVPMALRLLPPRLGGLLLGSAVRALTCAGLSVLPAAAPASQLLKPPGSPTDHSRCSPRCEHLSSSHLPPGVTHILSCFLLLFGFCLGCCSPWGQSQTWLTDWTIKATSLSVLLHEWPVSYSMP